MSVEDMTSAQVAKGRGFTRNFDADVIRIGKTCEICLIRWEEGLKIGDFFLQVIYVCNHFRGSEGKICGFQLSTPIK